jgi:hypothetical protein
MHSAILRALVFLAAAAVIAAATHANVMHAGGYGSRDAPLIITLAILLALGMAFVGVCFNEGRRWQAIMLVALILAGEAYWMLINADREVASLVAVSAPVAEMRAARATALSRLEKAETAKRASDAAAISEAAKKDCASNCAKLLLSAQQEADRELDAARDGLARSPEPRSAMPLSGEPRYRALGLAASTGRSEDVGHHRGLTGHRNGVASEAPGQGHAARATDPHRDHPPASAQQARARLALSAGDQV